MNSTTFPPSGRPAGRDRAKGRLPTVFAILLGVATVFGFAPFGLSGLPILTLALLLLLWQEAPTPRAAAGLGFAFGMGLFGAGVTWVYLALEEFGGMPSPLAAIAAIGLCGYLALYPAAAGWLGARFAEPGHRALAGAGAWTLAEWARGFVLTGFPWLSLGHAQLPAGSTTPLAGFAPLGGVFLVTLAGTLASAAVATAIDATAGGARRRAVLAFAAVPLLYALGAGIDRIEWTQPTGALEVSLLQGNVAQEQKFDPQLREKTFALYEELVDRSRGRLIVLPETAFPMFIDEVPPDILRRIRDRAAARDGDALVGLFTFESPLPGTDLPRYYNSVIGLGAGETQIYRKRHLVPFGETIPAEAVLGWVIRKLLAIPLASQTPGASDQPPFAIAGQQVAVNICYEDAFGADTREQAAAATLLVNVTNDAWYGRSLAAEQHNQIAAMRAKEAGRALLRATNTGITSAIAHDGREIARLPWYREAILEVTAQGRSGVTPFVRYGDLPAAILGLAAIAFAAGVTRRNAATPAPPSGPHGHSA